MTVEDAAWMTSPLLSVLIWNGKIMPFFRRQLRKGLYLLTLIYSHYFFDCSFDHYSTTPTPTTITEVLATQSMDLLFRGQNLLIKTLSLFTFQTGQVGERKGEKKRRGREEGIEGSLFFFLTPFLDNNS